jgi:hypothetical protein
MRTVLVIVPCGKAKVWDSEPGRGATPAREAYTGPPFKVNRRYVERFSTEWRILSAKYGFIPPDSEIEPYDVSFKAPLSKPIRVEALQEQVRAQGLHRFETIVAMARSSSCLLCPREPSGHTGRHVGPVPHSSHGCGQSCAPVPTRARTRSRNSMAYERGSTVDSCFGRRQRAAPAMGAPHGPVRMP